jgi:uroporphyrinogen-III decarboxylase
MDNRSWDAIKKSSRLEYMEKIPSALIVDSPWIPGYAGISTIDYFTMSDKWLDAYIQIKRDFPGLICIPDFWVEFGMTSEPSGFGCKLSFYENNTPGISPMIDNADDIGRLTRLHTPNPKTDGLMPFILNIQKNMNKKVKELGESIKIVAARGPLTIASHLMGVTEFLIALKIYPEETHKLLNLTSALSKNWLETQAEALGEVEGVLLLDDIVGFLSKEDFLEFAHPYLKKILHAFPDFVRMYHNDTDNPVCFPYMEELGVQIFNFTYKQDIAAVKSLCGDKVCLMGNIPPLEVLGLETPEAVKQKSLECLRAFGGHRGIILSAGGGTSPGTPKENILAMLGAIHSF